MPAAIVLGALAALFFGIVKPPLISKPGPPASTTIPPDETAVSIAIDTPDTPNEPSNPSGGSAEARLPDISNTISSDPSLPTIPVEKRPIAGPVNVPVVGPWPDGIPGPGNGFDRGVVELTALDRMPKALVQVAPVYPFEARSTGTPGRVVVEFVVDEAGRVHDPRVVSSSDPVFEEPTLRAVEQWRFTTGTRHGVPVRFRMSLPVTFNLDQ